MTIRLGLFDIHQVDPTDADDTATVYERRLAQLALADELGFHVAFTAERHFMATHRAPAPGPWLAAAAQRTERIRLGVLAYTLPLHEPWRLAEEVAVLDHLCRGRLEVGLGLGHRPEELAAVGVDPAARVPIFQERLALLRALWSGGRVSFESPHARLRDVAIHPLPLQEPHPPLWYAGNDPAAAGWAGGQGMSLALGFAPTSRLQPSAAAFTAARVDQPDDGPGEPRGSLALMRHVLVADTDEQVRAEMTDDLLRLGEFHHPGGATGAVRSRADAAAHAASLIRDEIFVAGSPATVAEAILAAHRRLGIDLFLANIHAAGVSDDRVARTLRLLAAEVAPRLATAAAEVPAPGGSGGLSPDRARRGADRRAASGHRPGASGSMETRVERDC